MLEFALAVLASNIFWVGYVLATIVVTLLILRRRCPHILAFIVKSEEEAEDFLEEFDKNFGYRLEVRHRGESYLCAFGIMLIWPLWLLGELLILLIKAFMLFMKVAFSALDRLVPDIKIEAKKEE